MRVLIVDGGKQGQNIANRLLAKDEFRLVFDKCGIIDGYFRNTKPHVSSEIELSNHVRRRRHMAEGDATPVHALASKIPVLYDGDLTPQLGGPDSCRNTARTAAQDNDIVGLFIHHLSP